MGAIEDAILDAVKESLNDGMVENIIKEKVQEGLKKSIEEAFRWGDLRKVLDKKIIDFMVPVVESRDMTALIPKLDTILTDICNNTALMDNKKLLENFKELMIEPDGDTINLSVLFTEYKHFVEENVNTYGREVVVEDKPYYEPIGVSVEVEKDESRRWSSYEDIVLHFAVDEEDQQDDLNRDVAVRRWKNSRFEGYEIDYRTAPEVKGLRYMDNFELLLLRLTRAGIRVLIDIVEDEDFVVPEAEPEATFE